LDQLKQMKRHIALVEDDDVIRENYADLLRRESFSVDLFATKESALAGLQIGTTDLVLLDITLNGERDAGFAVCAYIRRLSEMIPIVFLTSHDEEVDRISAFRLGADDYITKDASLEYLIVRLEALFRRHDLLRSKDRDIPLMITPPDNGGDDVFLDEGASSASWRGQRLDLPLTQYWILRELYQHSGQPRLHSDLMRAASIAVEPNTISAHVKAIRDEFRRIDPTFDQIRTERGRGYRWLPREISTGFSG
jgi:two-component system OmpR family response regulator